MISFFLEDMIDENYGVAVQFDEDDDEVCFLLLFFAFPCLLHRSLAQFFNPFVFIHTPRLSN